MNFSFAQIKTLVPISMLLAAAASSTALADYRVKVPIGHGQSCAGGACAGGGGPVTPAPEGLAISLEPGYQGNRLVVVTGGVAPYTYGLVFESMTDPAASCDSPTAATPPYASLNAGPTVATCESTYGASIHAYVVSDTYDNNNEMWIPGPNTYLQFNRYSFGYNYRVAVIDAEGNVALTPTFSMPPLPPM